MRVTQTLLQNAAVLVCIPSLGLYGQFPLLTLSEDSQCRSRNLTVC